VEFFFLHGGFILGKEKVSLMAVWGQEGEGLKGLPSYVNNLCIFYQAISKHFKMAVRISQLRYYKPIKPQVNISLVNKIKFCQFICFVWNLVF